MDEAEGKEDEEWYGEEEEEEEEELADLRAQMRPLGLKPTSSFPTRLNGQNPDACSNQPDARQMEEENQSLRDELSQEQMRVGFLHMRALGFQTFQQVECILGFALRGEAAPEAASRSCPGRCLEWRCS